MKGERNWKIVNQMETTWHQFGVTSLVIGVLVLGAAAGVPLESNRPGAEPNVRIWIGPSGDPLPFKTNAEIEEFLRTAKVVKIEEIPVGVTDPRKVWLEKDGVLAKACFRDVDIFEKKAVLPKKGVRKNWRDCCMFECAAYELAKLLGLNNIPVSYTHLTLPTN